MPTVIDRLDIHEGLAQNTIRVSEPGNKGSHHFDSAAFYRIQVTEGD